MTCNIKSSTYHAAMTRDEQGPAQPRRVEDYHHLADRYGYRYRSLDIGDAASAETDLSSGFVDIEEPQPGLIISRTDLIQHRQMQGEAEMQAGIMIGLAFAGTMTGEVDGVGPVALDAGGALAMWIGQPVLFRGRYSEPGVRQRLLSVYAHRPWLARHRLDTAPTLSAGPVAVVHWAPSPRLAALGAELMGAPGHGPLAQLAKETLALELVAAALGRLARPAPLRLALRPAELARMHRLRDMILAAPEADYTLAGLARSVGIGVSVLKEHFVRAFDQTVFGFLRDLRLDRAYRGLLDDGWTVAQAAFHAGYRHPTNFATAFRRRFGSAPRDLRR